MNLPKPRALALGSLALLVVILPRWAYFKAEKDEAFCARLEEKGLPRSQFLVTGRVFHAQSGKSRLGNIHVWRDGKFRSFSGGLWVFLPHLKPGQKVRLWTSLRCRTVYKNPASHSEAKFFRPVPELIASNARWVADSRERRWPVFSLERYPPGLATLVRAVWTGQSEALTDEVQEFYLKAGLLHIIALSGQHVVILVFLLWGILKVGGWGWFGFFKRPPQGLFYRHLKRSLPLIASFLLFYTSAGSPSMARTAAMASAVWLLTYRGMRASPVQWAASCIACLCLSRPSYFLEKGFVLSAVATIFLLLLAAEGKLSWKTYLKITVGLPLLMLPITAFYFAKVSWLSPISPLLLGWSWDFFWIPLGFLLPVLGGFPDFLVRDLFSWIEKLWNLFCSGHSEGLKLIGRFYQSIVCPDFLELFLLEALLLFSALQFFRERAVRRARLKPLPR